MEFSFCLNLLGKDGGKGKKSKMVLVLVNRRKI